MTFFSGINTIELTKETVDETVGVNHLFAYINKYKRNPKTEEMIMTKKKVVKKKKIGASTVVIAVLSVLLTAMLVLNLTGAWFTDREHAQNTLEFGAIELNDIDRDVFVIANPRRSSTILMPGHTLKADFEISIPADVVNIRNAFVRSCIKVTFDGDTGGNAPLEGRLGAIASAMGATSVNVEAFDPASLRQQKVTKIVVGTKTFTEFVYVGGGGGATGTADENKAISASNKVTYNVVDTAAGGTTQALEWAGVEGEDNADARLILERFNMIYKFKFDFNRDIATQYETFMDYTDPANPIAKWKTAIDSKATYWNYYYRELEPGDAKKIKMDYSYELVGHKISNALQQVMMVFDLEVQAIQAENLGWDNNNVSYDPGVSGGAGGPIDQHPGATNPSSTYVSKLTNYLAGGSHPVKDGLNPVASHANSATTPRNADNAIIAFAQVLGITDGVITGADVEGAYKPVVDEDYVDGGDRNENNQYNGSGVKDPVVTPEG